MNGVKKTEHFHLAGRVPAEPGWRAFHCMYDASGEPIMVGTGVQMSVAPIHSWGLLIDLSPHDMSALAALSGIGMGASRPVPLDAEGQRLDTRKGYYGFAPPGESNEDALARLNEHWLPYAKMKADHEQRKAG
jgi:hypothetical protein